MTYVKQTWANGADGETPIDADRLNHMEDGIASAAATSIPDGSITDTQISGSAAINADKLVDGGTNKLLTAAERNKLATLAAVAASGAYSDLTGKPTLSAVATSGLYSSLSGTPTLATVATTGAYADLTGKPTLYTDENAQDAVAALIAAGTQTGITFTYNDASNSLSATVTAGSTFTDKQTTTSLSTPLTDYWRKVEILDDGSATASWSNRLEFAFTPNGGSRGLTTYLNEYGELRVEPAKSNTVPARFFTKHAPGGAAHTVNVFEIMDDRTTRTILFSVDSSGNVTAPNLPGRITAASTAPSSPAVGDLWIDLSA